MQRFFSKVEMLSFKFQEISLFVSFHTEVVFARYASVDLFIKHIYSILFMWSFSKQLYVFNARICLLRARWANIEGSVGKFFE